MENGKKKAVVGNNLTDSNVEIYHRFYEEKFLCGI